MINCLKCSVKFEISEDELKFLDSMSPVFGDDKISIPVPNLCTHCRLKRRMVFRNESSLYKRKCDKTGKDIISMYKGDAPFPVYSPEEWFGDNWDPLEYERDFDFERPFFEQYLELRNKVPHLSLVSSNNQNCDYCNVVGDCKDSYLIYGSINCEDCYYGIPFNCKNCVDTLLLRESEWCYECVDSIKLYDCNYCQNCDNCSDLWFCSSVKNSQNCFGCVNLNHASYCIFNKQYSKEDYKKYLEKLDLKDAKVFSEVLDKFNSLKKSLPHRFYNGVNNEDVSGDYIFNSKNCFDCFGVSDCRDLKYCNQMLSCNDCMDVSNGEIGQFVYEVSALYKNVNNVLFSYFVWDNVSNLIYCGNCNKNVHDCFGSIGLKHARYCILNKQYSKEEYEGLMPQIIEHMKKMGEWGEFFPVEISPFSYRESVASEYFSSGTESGIDKPFNLIPQEKQFYEKKGLAVPLKSPKRRHLDRIAMRNGMSLFDSQCDKCDVEFETNFEPDRSEKVYCEKCFRAELY